MIRIAYICADQGVPVFGFKGSSIHVQEIVRAFIKMGAHVELFATRLGGEPPPDLKGIHIHKLPDLPKKDTTFREKSAILANSKLRALLEKSGSFDIIYERYSLWSFAGMEFAKTKNIPSVLEVNSPLVHEQKTYREIANVRTAENIAKRIFGLATVLIAVSKPIANYIKRFAKAGDKVHILPNGVNPDRFARKVLPALPAALGTFTVGFVGSMRPWHGLPVLIDAFSIFTQTYPQSRMLIVGDGRDKESLVEGLKTRRLIKKTHFTGAVPHHEVPCLLASMDVAVAPYTKHRGFYFSPLKIYEYMASGLPVVASNIGQIKEIIHNGKNGTLVPPDNPSALALALDRLQKVPELRARLGVAARSTIVGKHSWDTIVGRILFLCGFNLNGKDSLKGVGT
jgi:glycosyltransferase involved in cell wall biosynthesis